jgi:hypothetical protein
LAWKFGPQTRWAPESQIIMDELFVNCVLAFRRGIVGELALRFDRLNRRR